MLSGGTFPKTQFFLRSMHGSWVNLCQDKMKALDMRVRQRDRKEVLEDDLNLVEEIASVLKRLALHLGAMFGCAQLVGQQKGNLNSYLCFSEQILKIFFLGIITKKLTWL